MKQILINSEELQVRVAVVEDGRLQDFFMERTNKDRIVGSIYKGRIKNLEPSLQAAFVDIGIGKNAFLHYWDMLPATQEMLEGDGETDDDEELVKPGEEREEANRLSDSDSSFDPPSPPESRESALEEEPEEPEDSEDSEKAEVPEAPEESEGAEVPEVPERAEAPEDPENAGATLASNLLGDNAQSGLLSLSKKADAGSDGEAFEARLPENPPPQQEQDSSQNNRPRKDNNPNRRNRGPNPNGVPAAAQPGAPAAGDSGDGQGRHRRRRGGRNRGRGTSENPVSNLTLPKAEAPKKSALRRFVDAVRGLFGGSAPSTQKPAANPAVPAERKNELVPLTSSGQGANRPGKPLPQPRGEAAKGPKEGQGAGNALVPITSNGPKPAKNPPKPKKPEKKGPTVEDIPNLWHVDDEILVQVTKGPIGTKGARVTANLSIPGRYLVLLPNCQHLGVSRRVEDHAERVRLKQMVKTLEKPDNMGLICRTVGAGLKKEHFQRDLDILLDAWKKGEQRATRKAPVCVYQEPGLVERTLRDCLTQDIDEIVVDSQEAYNQAKDMLERFDRINEVKLKLHSNPTPIFIRYGISQQIENISNRKVMLPSGGYLCIDETEALIAIDVNTGKNRNGKTQPETILETNMEAVKEIARQLRLRNIGGLVVLDLIDMRSRKDQMAVYRAFKQYTSEDHARIKIYPISGLGLLEMSRQRESESLESTIYEDCPYCKGRGLIKTATSVSVEIQRRLNELLARKKDIKSFVITVHPKILARLRTTDHKVMNAMAAEYSRQLTFAANPDLHIEEYHITDKETGKEF